jgi:hypothetical protein
MPKVKKNQPITQLGNKKKKEKKRKEKQWKYRNQQISLNNNPKCKWT